MDEPSAWTCVATRGLAYAVVTLTPNPNASLPTAVGTVSGLLA